MPIPISAPLIQAIEIQRVRQLFDRQPAAVVAALIGVFLIYVFIFQLVPQGLLRAWAAWMLSTLTLRGWLWYAFRNTAPTLENARRWEYAAAGAAFLTGLGWGALNGPLYPPPPHGEAHMIIMLTTVAVTFAAAVYNGMSRLTFWALLTPTFLPTVVRLGYEAQNPLSGMVFALVAMLGVVMAIQTSQYRLLTENLRRRVISETLLEEQQAIFLSATLGIAVVCDRRVVKCNPRLGEMLGRRVADLMDSPLETYFVSIAELEKLQSASRMAFHQGRPYHGIFRLQRSDGSEFWAEFSGSAMKGDRESPCSVWLIAEAPMQGNRPLSG